MDKTEELAAEFAKLRKCGEELIRVSDVLIKLFSEKEAEPKKSSKKPKAKEVTLAEVRAVLADKSRQGHTAKVKELLAKYGADKLSGIDASKYAELKAEAEVLGDG